MFELVDNVPQSAVIKVIGVGGGGGNAVKHMIANDIEGVEFICANTDAQALTDMSANAVLQIGGNITKGLGAGANPDVGRQSAIEDRDRISEVLTGADMIFITAGMGGGTGTGAAPIIAEVAKDMGILTVAVVTRPFRFEGKKRKQYAEMGIMELQQHVDSLITIPNEKLLAVMGKNTSLLEAFKSANDVLLGAVQGIADLIIRPGMINVDFADVRTVMSEMGMAMMGTGESQGENRAREAAEAAIRSPLLEDVNLQGARGILVNITAGMDLSLGEFAEVGDTIEEFASDSATVVVGTVIDPDMSDELKVTVVATGLSDSVKEVPAVHSSGREHIAAPAAGHAYAASDAASTPNYSDYDLPAAMRRPQGHSEVKTSRPMEPVASAQGEAMSMVGEKTVKDMDMLDIPAFLRRQAN